MTTCVYCRKQSPKRFEGVEHVIPKSFGTFGPKTPTLHSVCGECNAYFGKHLDLALARDTVEGITRHKKGLISQSKQTPKSLRFTLEENDEAGDYGGALLVGVDPKTGILGGLLPQFWIRNKQTKAWERYPIGEIKNLSLSDEVHGTGGNREMRVLGPSREAYDSVIEELRKHGIPYKEKEMLGPPSFVQNVDNDGNVSVPGYISGTVDKIHKRALVKVLFNFATYYLGEGETSKEQWNQVRDFVRYDGETLLSRISEKEFWTGQERRTLRFADDSYNLRIENLDGNLLGVIQLYNLLTYEFILVQGYSLPPEKEVAYRFTPREEPRRGVRIAVSQ